MMRRHHPRVGRMELVCQPFLLELLEQFLDPFRHDQAGPVGLLGQEVAHRSPDASGPCGPGFRASERSRTGRQSRGFVAGRPKPPRRPPLAASCSTARCQPDPSDPRGVLHRRTCALQTSACSSREWDVFHFRQSDSVGDGPASSLITHATRLRVHSPCCNAFLRHVK